MSYAFQRHNPTAKPGMLTAPRREDGTPYEWACLYDGQARWVYADTLAEVVGAISGKPDYGFLSEHDQLVHRIRLSVRHATWLQAQLCSEAQIDGRWDQLAGWERETLLAPKFEAPNMGDGFPTRTLPGFAGQDVWTAPVGLVVLTTNHDCVREDSSPCVVDGGAGGSSLFVIDPLEDGLLLASLADCGVVHIMRRQLP